MPLKRFVGYDEQVTYSTAELSAMYVSEGKEPAIALAMAQTLRKAIKAMNQKEWRFWKKVREHEIRAGLIRTVEELEEAYKEGNDAPSCDGDHIPEGEQMDPGIDREAAPDDQAADA